ncbi:MAG: D-glycerate dehydrogenase [Candidatus Pacebacteria bacterium]|nr:D-glycerate dehydrogenase [Candidatus Paceibacterota bacterium]
MNKKIYITRRIPESGLKLLKENSIDYDMGEKTTPLSKKDFIKKIKSKPYDGIITFLTDIVDAEVFEACPTAKVFANFSVGYNNIDLGEAKKRNILVSNTPGTSATAVAEHTVALMMALTTRLVEADEFVRRGKFKGWDPELFIGTDLKDKIIGLIGCGEIGTEVAKMLNYGFGCKIIYSDIKTNNELEKEVGATKKETQEVLAEADIVSLHVPLLESTKHLINTETLSLMKKDSFLINTSRGGVIDEKTLVKALKNKTIKGAALDVFEFEPKLTKGLTKLDNVILTPHIASSRSNCRNMMSLVAAKNIVSALKNNQVINNVIKQ